MNYKVLVPILAGAVLLVTNPDQGEYVSWLGDQMASAYGNPGIGAAIKSFGRPILNETTSRQNYVFFSKFTTDVGEGTKIEAFGILHQFAFAPNTPGAAPVRGK